MGVLAVLLLSMTVVHYNSLGNTFLLYDLSTLSGASIQELRSDPQLPKIVMRLCHQYNTDGILLIFPVDNKRKQHRIDIVNRDGSSGALCLNGARCAAHYLWETYRLLPHITLQMGATAIDCQNFTDHISLGVPIGTYLGRHKINIDNNTFSGYVVDVGNPHFMIFGAVDRDWLIKYGNTFATHPDFTNGTNTEFVQNHSETDYVMHIYERGVGYSPACSSACVALATLLYNQKKLLSGQVVNITMPGGQVSAKIDSFGLVQLEAEKPHLIASLDSH